MKKLRSQILKLCVITLVCSGLGLSVAQPVEAKNSSRDFANWLQSMAKKTQTLELEHKLEPLKNSQGNLYQLIEQASQIVSQNNEDFNLPLDAGSASKNIHQILLVEWNQFQTGNAMAAIPPVPTVKSVVSFQLPKIFSGGVGSFCDSAGVKLFFVPTGELPIVSGASSPIATIPMSGGVAIGAP